MINGLMILILVGDSSGYNPHFIRYGSRKTKYTNQIALKEQGYNPGNVDGIFWEQTRKAVIAFQKDNGLDADWNCR